MRLHNNHSLKGVNAYADDVDTITLAGYKLDMTEDQVILLLRRTCRDAGSVNRWAIAHGIAASFVSDVLARKRPPGPKLTASLGLKRVVTYQRVAAQADQKPPVAA